MFSVQTPSRFWARESVRRGFCERERRRGTQTVSESKKECPVSALLDRRDLVFWNRPARTRAADGIAGRSYRTDSHAGQIHICRACALSFESDAVAAVRLLVRLLFEHLLCLVDRHIMRGNEEI